MIAHVAEAGESRGRVVLRICREPHPMAMAAAIQVARAFSAEIESLFVEDEDALASTRFAFSRVMSPAGRQLRHVSEAELERDYRIVRRRVAERLARMAAQAEVPVFARTMRDDRERALSVACASNGPWNVVVLGEPASPEAATELGALFAAVADATGIVVIGPAAARMQGPVVVVVDRPDDLNALVRAALRIARPDGERVVLLATGATREETETLDGEIRLALAADEETTATLAIARSDGTSSDARALIYAISRMRPGFVVSRGRGPLTADRDAIHQLRMMIDCPVFLARD